MPNKFDFDRVHLRPELVKSKKMGPDRKAQARKSMLVNQRLAGEVAKAKGLSQKGIIKQIKAAQERTRRARAGE